MEFFNPPGAGPPLRVAVPRMSRCPSRMRYRASAKSRMAEAGNWSCKRGASHESREAALALGYTVQSRPAPAACRDARTTVVEAAREANSAPTRREHGRGCSRFLARRAKAGCYELRLTTPRSSSM